MGYPQKGPGARGWEATWDQRLGFPPSCGLTNKLKTLPSRILWYAGGNDLLILRSKFGSDQQYWLYQLTLRTRKVMWSFLVIRWSGEISILVKKLVLTFHSNSHLSDLGWGYSIVRSTFIYIITVARYVLYDYHFTFHTYSWNRCTVSCKSHFNAV